jgi:hypothetical protein
MRARAHVGGSGRKKARRAASSPYQALLGKKIAAAPTKMRIDPTCRLITQLKRYLINLQVDSILIFVKGYKQPGLQPGCNKFFSL